MRGFALLVLLFLWPIEGVRFVTVRDLRDSIHDEVSVAWVPRALTPALRAMIKLIEHFAERERAAAGEGR